MTVSAFAGFSRATGVLLAGTLAMLPVHTASAWQQTPPSQPAPVYVPPPDAQFKQSMGQQQVRDQLQKNQLEEQLRQNSAATTQRPMVGSQTQTDQRNQANRAQSDLYRERQRGLIDRYQSTVTPVVRAAQPAPAHSGG